MKQLKLALLALTLSSAIVAPVFAQTAEEIIKKHIDAIGGADNWRKINSVKMVAAINANGMEIPLNMTVLQNKGMKVDFTINGMTGWQILTDKAGWAYAPFAGQTKPEAMTEEMLKQSQDQLDIQGGLIDYQQKGNKVAYLGKDDADGTECYKLKLTYKSGKEETVFIDASNYYHIRSKTKVKADGKEQELTSNMGNFQKLPEGIVYPMSLDNGFGPMTIKSVEVNKPIPDDFFKPKE